MTDLHLHADWPRPETWLPALSHFIATTEPRDDVRLLVDVSAPGAIDLLAHACERLAGDRPFGEVLATTDPPGPDAIPYAPTPQTPSLDDPAAAMDHVRRAKALVDELRDMEDRRAFLDAPDPFAASAGRPLVSVRIPTWGGTDLLLRRAIPSVLNGAYPEVEVVVCSDGPDPEARRAVEGHPDPRVRYLELPERPAYPLHPHNFWRVGGIGAVNHALDHCRGAVIAPLDHDDAFTYGHVFDLLQLLARGADMAFGQALCETRQGPWQTIGSPPLRHGHITHGAAIYTARLAHMRLDADAWIPQEPGDWNMWRRMGRAGAQVAFLDAPVLVHFKEQTSLGDEGGTVRAVSEPTDAEALADVLATPARVLLDIVLEPAEVAVR